MSDDAYDDGPLSGVDLAAVQRDSDLLDALAARAVPQGVDLDDSVLSMLAALVDEVDEGLREQLQPPQVETPFIPVQGGGRVMAFPVAGSAEPGHRRQVARTVAAAAVAAVALSISGVAAAVTGDPFTPYKNVYHAVSGKHGPLPAKASSIAKFHHGLAGVRADIAHGNLAGAQQSIDDARASLAGLSERDRAKAEKQIAALEDALARKAAGGDPTHPATGNDKPKHDPGTNGNGQGGTQGGGTSDPPGNGSGGHPSTGASPPGSAADGTGTGTGKVKATASSSTPPKSNKATAKGRVKQPAKRAGTGDEAGPSAAEGGSAPR